LILRCRPEQPTRSDRTNNRRKTSYLGPRWQFPMDAFLSDVALSAASSVYGVIGSNVGPFFNSPSIRQPAWPHRTKRVVWIRAWSSSFVPAATIEDRLFLTYRLTSGV